MRFGQGANTAENRAVANGRPYDTGSAPLRDTSRWASKKFEGNPKKGKETDMATITVSTQILTGNLGEWGDEDLSDVAKRFASRLDGALRAELAEYEAAGHEVKIEISIQRASGAARPLAVYVDDGGENAYELTRGLEERLPYVEQNTWAAFCDE